MNMAPERQNVQVIQAPPVSVTTRLNPFILLRTGNTIIAGTTLIVSCGREPSVWSAIDREYVIAQWRRKSSAGLVIVHRRFRPVLYLEYCL